MNKKLQNIFLISLITGGITGLISIIPFVAKFSVIILFTLISVPLLYFFKKFNLVEKLNEKESLKLGALIGVFSTLGFGVTFYPLVYVLSLFFSMTYLGGFSLMARLMNFSLALLFIIFVCVISSVLNAFSALMYYYVDESIKNIK
ncbi:hypothetical protein J6S88_06685 [bacterium]|nr:hypothetical protein [bacterium]